MVYRAIMSMADDEQRKYWVKKFDNFEIIAAYAQTELGHGSDVAALQTTATFDVKTDEFILHTPCLEATKWWPGSLAHNCTHALVLARLCIPDEDGEINEYGLAPFMM